MGEAALGSLGSGGAGRKGSARGLGGGGGPGGMDMEVGKVSSRNQFPGTRFLSQAGTPLPANGHQPLLGERGLGSHIHCGNLQAIPSVSGKRSALDQLGAGVDTAAPKSYIRQIDVILVFQFQPQDFGDYFF